VEERKNKKILNEVKTILDEVFRETNMTEIGQIIQNALENNDGKCLDNEEERAKVAAECEKALIQAFGEHYKDLAGQVGITPYQLIAGPLQKKESEDV